MKNKIISKCPVCDNSFIKKIRSYNGKTSFFSDKNNRILSCSNCGVAFIDPMPTKTQIDKYYKSYWGNKNSVQSSSIESLKVYKAEMYSRYEYLQKRIGNFKNKTILDFGAGHGLLREVLLEKEKDFNYYAVESDIKIVEQLVSNGVKAVTKIEELQSIKFDVIVVFHVLEHLIDSKEFIKKLMNYLKKNGLFFIEIPNQDHLWKIIVEPHILFYNKTSLEYLFKNISLNDFDIISCGRELHNIPNERKTSKRIRRIIGKVLRYFGLLRKSKNDPNSAIDVMEYRKIYKMDSFGKDRQWLRAIIKKN